MATRLVDENTGQGKGTAMSVQRFQVGDQVEWEGPYWDRRMERGPVIAVVAANTYPYDSLPPEVRNNAGLRCQFVVDQYRDHESYVIQVESFAVGQIMLHWPRVKGLRKVEG